MNNDQNILYLCDGKACKHPSTYCYILGGICRHTHKLDHAKNKEGIFNEFKRKGKLMVEQE